MYPRPSKPVPVVMDAEGKVDMPMVVRQPTLKVSSQHFFHYTFIQTSFSLLLNVSKSIYALYTGIDGIIEVLCEMFLYF